MQGEKEKNAVTPPLSDGINEFIQKHRTPIFVLAGLILLSLIAFIVVLSVMDVVRGRAINAVEEFSSRYEDLLPSITEEYSAVDTDQLLADIEAFTRRNSGYAAGKAWSLIANIHGQRKNWQAAETAWASAAKAAKKTYLAPLAFFNAAAAAEEQGKTNEAIEYYASSLASTADFSGAPRAQFAIGRLLESLGDNAAAIEAYRAVITGWSYDQIWPNLARSRIIALEAEE
jgi:predicted negative regulator of RcsB-dependent stress response